MRSIDIIGIFVIVTMMYLFTFSCEKKKQAKVIITEQEFVLSQVKENSFTVNARGKVKNIGEVDIKKIVVTGYCRSCGEEWIPGRWFFSNIEKLPVQQDVISYLAVGDEESFDFKEVASLLLTNGQDSPELPEKLECVIESFEIVGN